jgi:murein DD-endopeptidase MepM/ murein hydrolase activator NlpD
LVAALLGLLLFGNPGLVHSIDEPGPAFRTLDHSRLRSTGLEEPGVQNRPRSAHELAAYAPAKRSARAIRELTLERGRGAALVKPLSDVSQVDLLPLASEGGRGFRGPEFVERHVTVRRGDTFADLLQLYDVDVDEALAWHAGTRKIFNLAKLTPRRSLTLFFSRNSGQLAALEYRIDALNVLVAERSADREIHARVVRIPSSTEFRVIAGQLESNMATDCAEAGIPQRIVAELADIFAWDVDFEKLQRGDSFRVMYEVAIGEDGTVVQTGRILAAAIDSRDGLHTAVLRTAEDGRPVYYDLQGHPLDRGLLRSPLEYTRVTSGFSSSRMHPILNRVRPHQGVDLAAPQGTPVRAMADGIVTFAGWQGELGRTIRIQHGDGSHLESAYGHLSRIAGSVRVDHKVRRGEIIGYVGRTGLATGPHLHLEIAIDGKHVNPLDFLQTGRRVQRPRTVPLDREQLLLVSALDSVQSEGPLRLTRLSVPYATEPLQQLQ